MILEIIKVNRILLSSIFCLFFAVSLGQTWEVGGSVGGSGYMGDINPVRPYALTDLAFGLQVKKNFDGYFGLKLNYLHGQIEATDANSNNEHQINRNLNFYSPINEIGLQLEFNFFNYIPSVSKKRYTPYLFTGVGAVMFNPKTVLNDRVYELRVWGTEGQNVEEPYKKYTLSIPYGVGFKYNIFGKWSVISEVGYRTAFSDYLDDVSGNYPDFTALPINDPRRILSDRSVYGPNNLSGRYLFSPGVQRGDYRKRDTYFFTGITLTYTFGTDKCPPAF